MLNDQITERVKDNIIQDVMSDATVTLTSVADKYGVSRQYVSKLLKEEGYDTSKRALDKYQDSKGQMHAVRRLKNAHTQTVYDLINQSFTYSDIEDMLDLPTTAVARYARNSDMLKYAYERRPRGRRIRHREPANPPLSNQEVPALVAEIGAERRQEIVEAYAKGTPTQDIADHHDMYRLLVIRVLIAAGYMFPDSGDKLFFHGRTVPCPPDMTLSKDDYWNLLHQAKAGYIDVNTFIDQTGFSTYNTGINYLMMANAYHDNWQKQRKLVH